MKSIIALAVVLGATSANAETFVCAGGGRFAEIGEQKIVELKWDESNSQQVQADTYLIHKPSLVVQLQMDKSNSDGVHFIGLQVTDIIDARALEARTSSARGGLSSQVMYLEASVKGTDTVVSYVTCAPLDR